jgi:CubicO group peptidase (beta-lactamase class C family)
MGGSVALLINGCSEDAPSTAGGPTSAQPAAQYWPPVDDEWRTVTPSDAGWDRARLDEVVAFAGERDTRALLVLLDGRILVERYWEVDAGYSRDVASCQKSVVSLLVGVAEERGLLAVDDPVSSLLAPGWSNATPSEEDAIRLRHLLTMTSGLDDQLVKVAEPGAVWRYNNNAYHLLQPALERAAELGIGALTQQWLWEPIGVRSSTWRERRSTGPAARDAKGRALWGLSMTARDMGRFGLMVERGGRWEKRAIVPDAFLEAALSPSQDLNPAYGLLWWLNGQDAYVLPGGTQRVTGTLVPDAPPDLVAALGRDDQKLCVSRRERLVMARLGDRAGARSRDALSDFDTVLWAKLLAAAPRR